MAIFDSAGTTYDPWYTTEMGKYVDKVETALAYNLLEVHDEMTVFEVGSGTGNCTTKLAKEGINVTGKVLTVIKASNLEYQVGEMTTFVRGGNSKVFE